MDFNKGIDGNLTETINDCSTAITGINGSYVCGNSTVDNDCMPPLINITINGTYVCGNLTMINEEGWTYDAFLYIVVVLCFYALSLVLLMVKYIRREEEELSLNFYYTEFVKREAFNTATYQNKLLLEKTTSNPIIAKVLSDVENKT